MTIQEKKQALQCGVNHIIGEKYTVQISDKRMGQKFAIATVTNSSLDVHSNYMTYDEFNAYLLGYSAAKNAKIK